jgi:hypothetical protein
LRREKTGQQAKQENPEDGRGDEELWARLEELEVREALEKEWDEDGTSEEEEEENESENDSDKENDRVNKVSTGILDTNEQIIIGEEKDKLKRRRVSWAKPGCLENTEAVAAATRPASPDQRISFTHTDQDSESASDLDNITTANAAWPLTPGHIFRLTGIKSILKRTSYEPPSPESMPDYEPVSRREERRESDAEPWVNPVSDSVVEKSLDNLAGAMNLAVADSEAPSLASSSMPPKLSKFKAMRSQR